MKTSASGGGFEHLIFQDLASTLIDDVTLLGCQGLFGSPASLQLLDMSRVWRSVGAAEFGGFAEAFQITRWSWIDFPGRCRG